MKESPIKILLLESYSGQDDNLKKLLDNKGYLTESASRIDVVIKKIMSHSVNLVISRNHVDELNGFEIFKILQKYLRNCGVPFFLVLDSSEKEDMIIGLEMGIDNFIFHPYNEISLYCKIENQLKKEEELNIFATRHFSDFFNSSAIAMFFVSGNKVNNYNEAFQKMQNGCSAEMINLPVDNVFNIAANKQNEMNFRRFQNGITNECHLTNISCNANPGINLDINFFRGPQLNSDIYFAEILPSIITEMMPGNFATQPNFNWSLRDSADDSDNTILCHQTKLTKRETQIFELSANGMPIKLIADQLNLSERTVEKHRANIMAKANAKNMIEAIARLKNNRV
jgi:two-component system alkaline phosphatase synthesis response regulator PhoP